jgi:integrase
MDYARSVLKELKQKLKEGYVFESTPTGEEEKDLDIKKATFLEALDYVLEKKSQVIDKGTIGDYRCHRNAMEEWLVKKEMKNIPFTKVTVPILYSFFDYLKVELGLSNKTYNNYHTFFTAAYNLLLRRELITKNLCNNIKKLQVETGGAHKPFTQEQLANIKAEITKRGDKQFLLFISFMYYCFIRPHEELRFLRIEHIGDKTIFIPKEISKNKRGEHVIIPPALEKMIQEFGLRSYPRHYFIFTRHKVPGEKNVGKEYFYDRNVSILKELDLYGQDYDLYGYKHTGNVALYNAGADIKAIQKQNRHKTIEMTDKYLRQLGLIRNDDVYNKFPEF